MPADDIRRRTAKLLPCLALLLVSACFAADYHGTKVDGKGYVGIARSLDTGKYYRVRVIFAENQANVYLQHNAKLTLTLDDESIGDTEEILALDKRGGYWALYLDGLAEQMPGRDPTGSPTGARI
jgi:hypothetical protein